MRDKFKYIMSVILLVIFPISAVGLNVSVHKCKHKGTIHFTFFESSKNISHFNCCSTSCDISNSVKDIKVTEYIDKNENKKHHCCVVSNKIADKEKSSDMCNMSVTGQLHENMSKESKNQGSTKSTISYKNKSCCSDSNLYYAINFSYICLDNNKLLIKLPILINTYYEKVNFSSYFFDELTLKILKYPLKEPIFKIISFIHFTSVSGDDTEAPLFL
jgi:hypothetical protein